MARYSPGLILLLKMAEHAPSLGVRTIDLGKGMSLYKKRLMNASIPLAHGSVELPSWRSIRRHARRKLRSLLMNSRVSKPVRDALNSLRQLRGMALQRK
jgi:CelD/BcsL family acetyltransferase involved in cellulose biosynthesis